MRNKVKGLVVAVAAFGMLCMAGSALADDVTTTPEAKTLTGTVGWESTWTIVEDLTLFNSEDTTGANYDDDSFTKTAAITVSDFNSNDAVYVSIAKGAWTTPENYAGAKDTDDTDLSVKVSEVTAGSGTPALAAVSGADSYQSLTTSGAAVNLVEGGDSGVSGIEGAGFVLDFNVLMDWLTDVPGTYETTVTLTVNQGEIAAI